MMQNVFSYISDISDMTPNKVELLEYIILGPPALAAIPLSLFNPYRDSIEYMIFQNMGLWKIGIAEFNSVCSKIPRFPAHSSLK